MKKLSFLLSAAALLMTACSNDEVVEVAHNEAIGFDSFVDKSTRATDIDATTLQTSGFAVWGVMFAPGEATPMTVFVNNEVKWDATAGKYAYTPLRFWTKGYNYRFSAIAPFNATGLTVQQNTENVDNFDNIVGGLNLTFDNSAANADVDLCYAFKKVPNAAVNQDAVGLDFSHMLSRVKFTFVNKFLSGYTILKISNVKIIDAQSKGTINKTKGENTWTLDGESTPFEIDFDLGESSSSIDKTLIPGGGGTQPTEHHYLIPFTEAMAYQVTFDVTLINYSPDTKASDEIGTYKHIVDLPAINYVNNYSYNFKAEIDYTNINPDEQMHPIQFSPIVGGWGTFTDQTVLTPKTPEAEVTE